jgi:hypothetical protein
VGLFTDEYKKLLIIQYSDKPKALAQIQLTVSKLEEVYNLISSFKTAFDLDIAVGKQLDIIGKMVGISRKVPFAVPKNYFGFEGHPHSYPMGNKFIENFVSYPMKNKFEIPYTTGELNDYDYRFFMKAKIIKNNTKSTMIDINNLSLQNAIDYLFNNTGYVVDNKDMSFTLYIDQSFNLDMIQYMTQLGLIPKPQGVNMYTLIQYVEGKTFGFKVGNSGFGDKFSPTEETYFANKINIGD